MHENSATVKFATGRFKQYCYRYIMTRPQFFSLLFHRDTGALFGSIVFIWATVSIYVDTHYTIQDLQAHRGILTAMDSAIVKQVDKPLFKETTRKLYLQLNSSDRQFFVRTTTDFAFIISKLSVGDSISIYTKPKVWGIFGLKKENEISHMVWKQETLLNFENYRDYIGGLFFFTLAAAIFSLTFFLVRFNKRYYREVTYLKLTEL